MRTVDFEIRYNVTENALSDISEIMCDITRRREEEINKRKNDADNDMFGGS